MSMGTGFSSTLKVCIEVQVDSLVMLGEVNSLDKICQSKVSVIEKQKDYISYRDKYEVIHMTR